MISKTITYVDYNGVERTETFFFNLTKAEIMEMELSVEGGLSDKLVKVINAKDVPTIMKTFKDLVLKSYGVKSQDGRQFIKNKELVEAFSQTEAYSILFTELAMDDKIAATFVNGIVPKQPNPPPKN